MLGIVQIALTYTLPFLAVLTLVVTVHEFGHFVVARLCGVACDRFSIGFGRALVSWRSKSGMEWRIGWIPAGGYVRFKWDESIASVPDAENLAKLKREILAKDGQEGLSGIFHFKPLWQRVLVVLGGPVANFLLSIAIFAILIGAFGKPITTPLIGRVLPNTPAASAGFKAGDLILSVDARPISDFRDVAEYVALHSGSPIRIEVRRGAQIVPLLAVPARVKADASGNAPPGLQVGLGYLGLEADQSAGNRRVIRYGPLGAVVEGVRKTGSVLGNSVTYIRRMLVGEESGNQLSGVIGIAGRTGSAAADATRGAPTLAIAAMSLGLLMIQMVAFISTAIGFANLLPIPVLDGGHLLFYAYEAVARRPVAARVQDAGYRVGFALLAALMLFAAWNDLQRYRVFHLIGGLFS
ncbi:MAG TPA: M50 family metallopeptidase [Caulobacteraceae bacterium]